MTKPFSIIRVFEKFPAPALSFKMKVSTEIKQNRSGLNGYEDYTIGRVDCMDHTPALRSYSIQKLVYATLP